MNSLTRIQRCLMAWLTWRPRLAALPTPAASPSALTARTEELPHLVSEAAPVITLAVIQALRDDIRAGTADGHALAEALALFREQRQHVQLLLKRQSFYQLQRDWGQTGANKSAMVAGALEQIEQELAAASSAVIRETRQ
jgi:hypothetical protein